MSVPSVPSAPQVPSDEKPVSVPLPAPDGWTIKVEDGGQLHLVPA